MAQINVFVENTYESYEIDEVKAYKDALKITNFLFTQDEVMKTITNLKKDRTIIIIAHRLTTIQNCDKIYVLKRGVVVGSGVHKDLIKDCEDYKKLYLTEQV